MTDHTPDLTRIPASLQPLKWVQFTPDTVFGDGWVLLVAVPIYDLKERQWFYKIEVVRIQCEEEFSEVWCNDEPWDWKIEEVDWYVVIRR